MPEPSLCVLVVEDEALIMMATVDMLTDLGHSTISARSAKAALAAIDSRPEIEIVVTDVNLPDMDGTALAAEIRRRRPRVPLIFASGYRLTLDAALTEGGPTAILPKPYLARELTDALRKVLQPAA